MFRRRSGLGCKLLFGATLLVAGAIANIAEAQPRRGAVSSQNLGQAVVPASPTVTPAPSKSDIEAQQYQDLREDRLAAMERLLKITSQFQTAEDQVKATTNEAGPPAPKLTKELQAVADSATTIRNARRLLVQNPTVPLDLEKIGSELDQAVSGLKSLDKDSLAADLLMIGFSTLEKAVLLKAKPANLLPALLTSFLRKLELGGPGVETTVAQAKETHRLLWVSLPRPRNPID